ncbi:MAG TPA: hypothetical protein VJN70_07410 [Gemmatimonadaceae bacterium]|nr:hypothetical protein [Gemmatimonadaceae bacterium]
MRPSVITMMALCFGGAALAGCTGGSMGDTRGGGAAPGQSGGRDTTHAAAPAATSGAVTPTTPVDTTKQRAKKQP